MLSMDDLARQYPPYTLSFGPEDEDEEEQAGGKRRAQAGVKRRAQAGGNVTTFVEGEKS